MEMETFIRGKTTWTNIPSGNQSSLEIGPRKDHNQPNFIVHRDADIAIESSAALIRVPSTACEDQREQGLG